jgi:hypothetical protein
VIKVFIVGIASYDQRIRQEPSRVTFKSFGQFQIKGTATSRQRQKVKATRSGPAIGSRYYGT